MVTLYRNYTVVVQNSVTFDPDNDLELLLFEGKLEIKIDPTTGNNDIFQYGTTVKAVQAVDQYGVPATALAADTTNRPGEYDFVGLDLDGTSTSIFGETLYSVIARPAADTSTFDRAMIIVENTDISDPNVKQLVKLSVGSTNSMASNIAFAGGTVRFSQYTTGVTNDATMQHLKLIDLPSGITNLIERPTAAPAYAVAPIQKLIPRFNVYYGTDGTEDVIVWQGVPAYLTADSSWVIWLQADEYNILREQASIAANFGTGAGLFDLGAIYSNFVVSVDVQAPNIHVRNFQEIPTTTIPTSDSNAERVCVHSFIDGGGNRIVGVGEFSYASAPETPSYNLDIKGARGLQHRVGSTIKLLSVPSSTRIGYDTTQTYFGATPSAITIQLLGVGKFVSVGGATLIGDNALGYPRIDFTSTLVKMEQSVNTYLSIDTSHSIFGNINVGANSFRMLSLTPTSQKFGYEIGGASDSYFGAASNILVASIASSIKFSASTVLTKIGVDVSSYPVISVSSASSSIKLEMTATTYAEFIGATTPTIKMYVLHTTAKEVFRAESGVGGGSSYTYLGYEVGVSYYSKFWDSGIELNYLPSVNMLQASASVVKLGTNTLLATVPVIDFRSTYVNLKGTASTYIKVTNSDEIFAYVNVGGSKRALSLDGTDARFGYWVDTAAGVYFKAITTSATVVHQGRDVFKSSSSETLVGYDCSTYPRLSIISTSIALRGIVGSYITVGNSLFLGDGEIYMNPGALTVGDAYNYRTVVGAVNSPAGTVVGFLKIPFGHTVPGVSSSSQYYGIIQVFYQGAGSPYSWFLKVYTSDGWKVTPLT